MTRLIDADALKRELMKAFNCENATKYGNRDAKQQAHSYSTIMLYEVSDIIENTFDNAPTVTDRYSEGYSQGYIDGSIGADCEIEKESDNEEDTDFI